MIFYAYLSYWNDDLTELKNMASCLKFSGKNYLFFFSERIISFSWNSFKAYASFKKVSNTFFFFFLWVDINVDIFM